MVYIQHNVCSVTPPEWFRSATTYGLLIVERTLVTPASSERRRRVARKVRYPREGGRERERMSEREREREKEIYICIYIYIEREKARERERERGGGGEKKRLGDKVG